MPGLLRKRPMRGKHLLSISLEAVFFQIAVQSDAADPQVGGQSADIAAAGLPCLHEDIAVAFPGFAPAAAAWQHQVGRQDHRGLGLEETLFDNALLLLDIAGPIIAGQQLQRRRRQPFCLQRVLLGQFAQDISGNLGDIGLPVPQRRRAQHRL